MPSDLLSSSEATELLRDKYPDLTREDVARMARLGILPGAVKSEGEWRIPRESVITVLTQEPAIRMTHDRQLQGSESALGGGTRRASRLRSWSLIASVVMVPLTAATVWLMFRGQSLDAERVRSATSPLVEAVLTENGTLLRFEAKNPDAVLDGYTLRYHQDGHRLINAGRVGDARNGAYAIQPSPWLIRQISKDGRWIPAMSKVRGSELANRFGLCSMSESSFEIPAMVEFHLLQHGKARNVVGLYMLHGFAGWCSSTTSDCESATARVTDAEFLQFMQPGDDVPELKTTWHGPYAR